MLGQGWPMPDQCRLGEVSEEPLAAPWLCTPFFCGAGCRGQLQTLFAQLSVRIVTLLNSIQQLKTVGASKLDAQQLNKVVRLV
jgi:hypothetical protein